jgi:hypothetical protein
MDFIFDTFKELIHATKGCTFDDAKLLYEKCKFFNISQKKLWDCAILVKIFQEHSFFSRF